MLSTSEDEDGYVRPNSYGEFVPISASPNGRSKPSSGISYLNSVVLDLLFR